VINMGEQSPTIIGRDPNGEDADLKSVGCKNFAGSNPVSSVGSP
jgi:hypothetical protein